MEVAASDRRRCRGLVQFLSPDCRLRVQLFKQVEPETIDLLHRLGVRRWVFAERPSVRVSHCRRVDVVAGQDRCWIELGDERRRVGVCWLLKFVGEVDALSRRFDRPKRDLSVDAPVRQAPPKCSLVPRPRRDDTMLAAIDDEPMLPLRVAYGS